MSPVFSNVWALVIDVLSASIAMYCLDQFSLHLKDDLKPQNAKFKSVCMKLGFAFSLYQNLIIDAITTAQWPILSLNAKLAYYDIKVGIPALLLSPELFIISILHIFAFPWQPYRKSNPDNGPSKGGFLGTKAFIDALNIWDLVKGLGRAVKWLFVGRKHRSQDATHEIGNLYSAVNNHTAAKDQPLIEEQEVHEFQDDSIINFQMPDHS